MTHEAFQQIASRDFSDRREGWLRLEIGLPEPDSEGLWRCPVRVRTADKEWTYRGTGTDSFQALVLALGTAKIHVGAMQKIRGPLRWRGETDLGLDFVAVQTPPSPADSDEPRAGR
jgi:hypothetical protein